MGDVQVRAALQAVMRGDDLEEREAEHVMDSVMEGSVSPALMAAIVVALVTKGESVAELTGMARSLRRHVTPVHLPCEAVDTCGTGGDDHGTFNISTTAALVAAAAGCPIAKHGGRAASSRCGSADVLEALGVTIALSPEQVRRCVEEVGIGFMFAPTFHPALRHVQAVRRELGIRTVFNLLGPLANPAGVQHQALGVANVETARLMADVLLRLGHRRALVFTGPGGIDELGLDGPSQVFDVSPIGVVAATVDPAMLGLEAAPIDAVGGGDATMNAGIIREVLGGVDGPRRDIVLLNAAAVLLAGERVSDMPAGIELARQAIDSGAARDTLRRLVIVSNRA